MAVQACHRLPPHKVDAGTEGRGSDHVQRAAFQTIRQKVRLLRTAGSTACAALHQRLYGKCAVCHKDSRAGAAVQPLMTGGTQDMHAVPFQ